MLQKLKNIYHLFVSVLANIFFMFPSRGMKIIGVTGTDGKTTTSNMIYHILKKSGKNTALVSTIGAIINNQEIKTGFHVTTPGPFFLQSIFKQIKKSGTEYVVLEVTSHALDQFRTWGIRFDIGIITNITHEHLDYHKTYENYLKAKNKLITQSRLGIVNIDDISYKKIKELNSNKNIITFGKEKADYNFSLIDNLKSNFYSEYNRYNALAAIACLDNLNISVQNSKKYLETFNFPKGRGDIVYDNDFIVMIDFAHTPNSIDKLLYSIKKYYKNKKIVHVFGSAGKRDIKKRRIMGESSSRYASKIILTAEDSRGEDVYSICRMIQEGIIKIGDYPEVYIIEDRGEAINAAISNANKNDFIVITGKGHEESMNNGKGEVSWSDYEAVERALKKLHEKKQ